MGQRGEAVSSISVAFPRLCTPPAQCSALHATMFWPGAVKSPLSFSPPRAFKNEHNRSHGHGEFNKHSGRGRSRGVVCKPGPTSPSSQGAEGGHSLLTKGTTAPHHRAGSWWGIRNLGTALPFLPATRPWLEAGIRPSGRGMRLLPAAASKLAPRPCSRRGLHNAAYESEIARPCQPVAGQDGEEKGGKINIQKGCAAPLRCCPSRRSSLAPSQQGKEEKSREGEGTGEETAPVLLQG